MIMMKFKCVLRRWLFSDYKWVTRAEVRKIICASKWEHRDRPGVLRVLEDLESQIN